MYDNNHPYEPVRDDSNQYIPFDPPAPRKPDNNKKLVALAVSCSLLGGIVGGLIATANFFFMSLFVTLAADKAEAQDVAGGQKLIQLSYMGRMLALFLILFLCAKSGKFHLLALVIPLVFTRPILTVSELFKKKGGNAA